MPDTRHCSLPSALLRIAILAGLATTGCQGPQQDSAGSPDAAMPPQGQAPVAPVVPGTSGAQPRLTASAYRSQLDLLPRQIETTTAALNNAAIASGLTRAEAIQGFNEALATLQGEVSTIVGELDELERLGQKAYFASWPRTRVGTLVDEGATVPPEAYDPLAWEMQQLGKDLRSFMTDLDASGQELAKSPGLNTPRLTSLLGRLNSATPGVLRSVHQLSRSIGSGAASEG